MIYEIITDLSGIDTYSYSKLNFDCMYCYWLDYVATGKEKLRRVNNGFAQTGLLVHSLMEDFSNGKLVQFELKQKLLDEFDEKVPYGVEIIFDNGSKRDMTAKYKQQCADFLETYHGLDGEQVGTEESFSLFLKIKDKMLILRGVIDVIIKDDDGEYHIWDYKSKSLFKNKEEADIYFRQLYLYSLYVKYKFGKYPKTINFLQFRFDHTETREFDEKMLEEALNWAHDQIETIENTNFWSPKCLEEKNKEKPDLFYSRNLCSYRFSCEHSPLYEREGND
jgi:ATP-dependent exoDNAse (exonuclease V) beta subunit